jgi:hypothetical protein
LPGRQALGHEAEEFGVAAPRKVGQWRGLKQSKSVRTRYLDNLAVRSRERQLLKRIERRPAIATGVGFNDQAAEESTDAGNEDANVFPSAEIDRLAANVLGSTMSKLSRFTFPG